MRLTRSLRLIAVALFPLGLVACAGNAPPAYDVPLTVEDVTTTHVLNTNTYPVTVYLTQAGVRRRLGVVESLSAGLFQVPPEMLRARRDFKLVAAPLGPHTTFISETFMLQPGQAASWRLREASTRLVANTSVVSVN